jgi:trimeric autotransporter adhesin
VAEHKEIPMNSLGMRSFVMAGMCSAACSMAAAHLECPMGWNPEPIGTPGTNTVIRALMVFDDGTGPALYAGGPFVSAGGVTVNGVARWDGAAWTALGVGIGGIVNGLGAFDDGTGPALYATGSFQSAGGMAASNVARWDGTAWSALGTGLNQGGMAMTAFNDGTGPALYIAGAFSLAGGVRGTNGIARWDGAQWSAVGSGVSGSCNVLLVYDDGTGTALYAGGTFSSAGGMLGTARIARWRGTNWQGLGGGIDGPSNPRVNALAAYDDGTGVALYAGGNFSTAGLATARNLAKWNGSTWSPVGGGTDNTVIRMALFDDGRGSALYLGGSFVSVGSPIGPAPGLVVNQIARWDGQVWEDLQGGVWHPVVTTVSGLAVFDDGSGESLFVAGGFETVAGGLAAGNIARWGCPADGICYANCDASTTPPVLNVDDFICFISEFAVASTLPHGQQVTHYANCDGSMTAPVLNVDDFICFIGAFAAGCP